MHNREDFGGGGEGGGYPAIGKIELERAGERGGEGYDYVGALLQEYPSLGSEVAKMFPLMTTFCGCNAEMSLWILLLISAQVAQLPHHVTWTLVLY